MVVDRSNVSVGDKFIIDKGDGDRAFFSGTKIAQVVERDWFNGKVARGDGILLIIVEGDMVGEYIIITSRQINSIDEQLKLSDWVSVIVHRVKNPNKDFSGDLDDVYAVGMAAIRRSSRNSA